MSAKARILALAVLALSVTACERLNRVRQPMPSRTACLAPAPPADPAHPTAGMVRLQGGVFSQGARPERPEEGPPHPVTVGAFLIDRTDVTNADFARFVAATGYVTEAERPLDPKLYPGLSDDQRRPASLVFVGAKDRSDLADPSRWWRLIPGADWRHPYGPGSTIRGLDAMPVVQIAYADALAYADRRLGADEEQGRPPEESRRTRAADRGHPAVARRRRHGV